MSACSPTMHDPHILDADAYRAANADLRGLGDEECRTHWQRYGRAEGRLPALPVVEGFDPVQYRHLNVDLEDMSPRQLLCHYALHGRSEGRSVRDELFDEVFYGGPFASYARNIRPPKSAEMMRLVEARSFPADIVVVDHHDESQGGASYFAIQVARQLGATLAVPGNAREKALAVGSKVLDYGWDESLLYHLLLRAKPRVVLLNSANRAMLRALPFLQETTGRLLLHSHEVAEDYLLWTRGKRRPDFVVSRLIAMSYGPSLGSSVSIGVQPPLIPPARLKAIDLETTTPTPLPRNRLGETLVLGGERRIAVMVGALSHRKNPGLLGELVESCSSWDFLWIGGSTREAEACLHPQVFHQAYTERPWDLMRLADIFVLTSLFDPCPYAVLEAWLLQKPVLSFAESLRTAHPSAPWNLRLPGKPEARSAAVALATLLTAERSTLVFPEARAYVCRNFTALTAEYTTACDGGTPSRSP